MSLIVARFHLPRRPKPKAGDYLVPDGMLRAGGGEAMTKDYLYAALLTLEEPLTVDRIGFKIDTGGGAGALARAGIYDNVAGRPKNLIVDGGAVACVVAADKEAVIAKTLSPGEYWLVWVDNDNTVAVRRVDNAAHGAYLIDTPYDCISIRVAFTYAALPADASALSWAMYYRVISVWLRVA